MKSTLDYSIFKDFSSNREVDPKHVKQLMVAIATRNLLHVNPIVVDEQMRVVDGQHRLEAAKILNVPIYYVQDKIDRADISMLNSNQKNWTAMDYINFYTVEKKVAYVTLSNLMNHHPDMATSALITLSNSEGRRDLKSLKAGNLEVLNAAHCERVCELCETLNRRFQNDFVFDSRFPLALSKALQAEGWETDIFIKHIEAGPRSFVRCHTKEQYLEMIEEIYNKGLSKNQIRIR
jgi:hypothetical protein